MSRLKTLTRTSLITLRRAVLPMALSSLALAATIATAAEIDVQLTTTLPQVRAVKLDAIPVTTGPSTSLAVMKPTDVKAAGGEKVESLLSNFSNTVDGMFRYFVHLVLLDENGQALSADDDDDSDSTPIVDIFIDTDCEDCGDYDFVAPPPPGGQPSTIRGELQLLSSEGDAKWKVTTTGNSPDRPAAYAQVELLNSKDPKAPLVLAPPVTIPLDRVTLEFADDLIFKDGEPANLNYQIYASWLDGSGAKIGQTEVFQATAEVAKKRKDGTYVYRPWRLHSDLSEVVGETWSVEAMTDTYLNAAAFEYTLTPTDGGPKLPNASQLIKNVSQYLQKGQARDVSLGAPLKAGQTWTFQARLLDGKGIQIGKTSLVGGEAIIDDGEGLVVNGNDTCKADPINCIPGVRIRYSDNQNETNPYAVWVTSTRFASSAIATTLELTVVPEKSTGPSLTQAGQAKAGILMLPVDTSRVLFESDFSLLFPSGTPDDKVFTYALKTAWLDQSGQYLADGESGTLQLQKKNGGGGWTWVSITHQSTVKIR